MAGSVQTKQHVPTHQDGARSRPIDLVYLARQTLGDPGLESEILMLYSEMAATYLKRVTDSSEPEDIAVGLHALKGASAGIGANAVAEQARSAEEEIRASGKIGGETLGDLAIAVEEVRVFISELLAQ